MRVGITFFLLIMGVFLLNAQNESFSQDYSLQHDAEPIPEVDSLRVKPFSVNAGLSAFTNLEGMYGFNTYVAPQWSLMPFNKVQVDVMPFVSRTNYYNIPAWGQADATKLKLDESMLQFGLYAQGTYIINERWYAGAAVFLDTNLPENSNLSGLNNYGASTYVGYKFSDNFSAEVSFGVSKYPTFYSPSPSLMPMMHPRNPYNRFSP